MTCSQSTLLSQSTLSESEDDDALEIEPETLQLQQHRFSTLSQAIASLEPTPISARTACGKPPQNTSSVGVQRPCRALVTFTYRLKSM